MAWIHEAPSLSTLFSTYASVMASIMFLRSMVNEFLPQSLRAYLESIFYYFFKSQSTDLTLVFEESTGMGTNQVFKAAECYLSTKISPNTEKLKVSKLSKQKNLTIQLEKGGTVLDAFEGIELKWTFMGADENQKEHDPDPISSYELCFLKKHKDLVLNSYVPFVLDQYSAIKNSQRVLKMHSLSSSLKGGGAWWESIVLEHPSTFETLAMSPDLKRCVMEDLDRFVRRKEFYKRVGRAWKRGYLLYGPPGTGKSSLVAAMANYLKFDVYDLQLANIMHDSDLRKLLLATANRSILVIEDIDCSVSLPNRLTDDAAGKNETERKTQMSSGCHVSVLFVLARKHAAKIHLFLPIISATANSRLRELLRPKHISGKLQTPNPAHDIDLDLAGEGGDAVTGRRRGRRRREAGDGTDRNSSKIILFLQEKHGQNHLISTRKAWTKSSDFYKKSMDDEDLPCDFDEDLDFYFGNVKSQFLFHRSNGAAHVGFYSVTN